MDADQAVKLYPYFDVNADLVYQANLSNPNVKSPFELV